VAAMYTVTAQEVAAASEECNVRLLVAGEYVPQRFRDTETMPLISFPWLFQRELGMIAKKRDDAFSVSTTAPTTHFAGKQKVKTITKFEESGNVLAPLPILPSSISAETDTEVMKSSTPLDTGLPTSESEQERKDSCTSDISTTEITSSATPACEDDSTNATLSLGAKTNDTAPSDVQMASTILAESSAFEHSDHEALTQGLAEIDAMPAESLGEYQTPVPEVVPEVMPTQLLPETGTVGAEEMLLLDVDADADDEGASEGEQVSPQQRVNPF
jgi:hypothetical protein